MTIHLMWEEPAKVMIAEERAERYQSDSGVPGTYVPNMSEADQLRWRARLVKGKDPRVELRRRCGLALVLIVVRYKGPGIDVTMSMNRAAHLIAADWWDLKEAVKEAYNRLVEERGCYQASPAS